MNGELIVAVALVLLLAWANGANDMAKGVATLMGSGAASARNALLWGTLCTVLGGASAVLWGSLLMDTFARGFLASGFEADADFLCGALSAAGLWLLVATRLGWPVSTTHALLGGIIGAALAQAGPSGVASAAVAYKALLPLLVSPLLAIMLCAGILWMTRRLERLTPEWRTGCCSPDQWRENPFVCATASSHGRFHRFLPGLWRALHWLSGGATSFARGLNDVPKIAAILFLAVTLAPDLAAPLRAHAAAASVLLVSLVMGVGGLWGGHRVLDVLAHRVVPLDPRSGLAANLGTSMLVLVASPLGLPVSTTHVSTGALLGIRLADKTVPAQGDAMRWILFAWVVTLPVTGGLSAAATALLI